MKKRFFRLMVLLMALTMLVGCSRAGDTNTGNNGSATGNSGTGNTVSEETSDFGPGIYTELSGIDGSETVMTVNGDVYGRITPADVDGIIAKYL